MLSETRQCHKKQSSTISNAIRDEAIPEETKHCCKTRSNPIRDEAMLSETKQCYGRRNNVTREESLL